jgi:hypothetical protein
MNDAATLDESTLRIGLLMESVQSQQKLAESQLQSLAAHTQGLDAVVRDEIRRTLIEELQAVTAQSRRAAAAFGRAQRAHGMRAALWSLGIAALCTAVPGALSWWALPAPAEIAALKAQRTQLAGEIDRLRQAGGRIDLRRCGAARLCVRIDREAPAFGAAGDYRVVAGY